MIYEELLRTAAPPPRRGPHTRRASPGASTAFARPEPAAEEADEEGPTGPQTPPEPCKLEPSLPDSQVPTPCKAVAATGADPCTPAACGGGGAGAGQGAGDGSVTALVAMLGSIRDTLSERFDRLEQRFEAYVEDAEARSVLLEGEVTMLSAKLREALVAALGKSEDQGGGRPAVRGLEAAEVAAASLRPVSGARQGPGEDFCGETLSSGRLWREHCEAVAQPARDPLEALVAVGEATRAAQARFVVSEVPPLPPSTGWSVAAPARTGVPCGAPAVAAGPLWPGLLGGGEARPEKRPPVGSCLSSRSTTSCSERAERALVLGPLEEERPRSESERPARDNLADCESVCRRGPVMTVYVAVRVLIVNLKRLVCMAVGLDAYVDVTRCLVDV